MDKRLLRQLQTEDREQQLEVVYRVLKDQLRRAQNDLIDMKKDKEGKKYLAIEIKKKMTLAAQGGGLMVGKVIGEQNEHG